MHRCDEAHSGSIDDVSAYLFKLKKDVCIGAPGYPKYIVIGGDQQTYAHMKNLKLKYGGRYDWMYPVPGDWHIMKTCSEVLKNVLADGGLRCLQQSVVRRGK